MEIVSLKKHLNQIYLFIINLILSVIAIFIRAAKTDRYTQALKYLEAINNRNIDLDIFGFNDCQKMVSYNDKYYCDSDGNKIKKPKEKVRFQNIYKKWNKIELALNISRAAVTLPILIFTIIALKKETKTLLNLLITFIIFLLLVSGAWVIIRFLAAEADDDIALFEDGEVNNYVEKLAISACLDFFEIIFYGVELRFVMAKRGCSCNSCKCYSLKRGPPPQPKKAVVAVRIKREVVVGVINTDNHPLDNFN